MSNPLSGLFGHSPIKPMQEHMAKAQTCALKLLSFFNAVLAGDWPAATRAQEEIHSLENEADKLKKSIRLHLPNSLFLPVPRSDLLELLSMQDKIANRAKDIAGIMLGRKMRIPEPLAQPMLEYVEASIAASAGALAAIQELDELVEAGFSGREINIVQRLIEELDDLEHRTDVLQIDVRAKLFALEKQLPPVDTMFLYQVIDWIGDLADRAQKVGSRLQLLIAR